MDGWMVKTGLGPPDIKKTTTLDVGPIIKKGTLLPTDWTLSQRLTQHRGGGTTTTTTSKNQQSSIGGKSGCSRRAQQEEEEEEDKPLAVRGRSASEPSFLSASRAVKVRVASPANSPSSYTPPAVKGAQFNCFVVLFFFSIFFFTKLSMRWENMQIVSVRKYFLPPPSFSF
jgi:hypothetical protein